MKILKRLLLVTLGAIAFTYSSWQLPLFLGQSTYLAQPTIQEAIAPQAALNVNIASHLTDIINTYPEQTRDHLLKFVTADQLFRERREAEAETLYRQVKPEIELAEDAQIPPLIYTPEELSPESLAHWNAAQAGVMSEAPELAIAQLQILVETEPGFIEGHILLSELLMEEDQEEEAIAVLEQATTLYPDEPNLVYAWVEALAEEKDYLEASIAARTFSSIHFDKPYSADLKNLQKNTSVSLKAPTTQLNFGGVVNLLGGIVTGARVPWESLDSAIETVNIVQLMIGSESQFGDAAADSYKQSLTLVNDPEVEAYIQDMGDLMARFMGRDDFNYEFFVVKADDVVNASAFPGGKVFVNTGAILAANSQAELMGLMAHEVAHAVLSHGVQKVVRNDLLGQLADEVPFGEFIAGMTSLHYNRNQERQADRLGARVLARSGYAADGLQNFMATLASLESASTESTGLSFLDDALSQVDYFSTHPATQKRVNYLNELIVRNGYNRYALEGVDRHLEIKARLRSI